MAEKHYSGQFETDRLIAEYFGEKSDGVAVEVGASHGTVSSNTLYFEQLGWKCLCIEPNPNLYQELKRNRKLTLECAVSAMNSDNPVKFTVVTLENGDTTAISGLRTDERLIKSHPVTDVYACDVRVRTLDDCLTEVNFTPGIDFVSIDTEGTELDVLAGFSLFYWKPYLLVIENNFDDPEIEQYLKERGYSLQQRYVINDFYTRD